MSDEPDDFDSFLKPDDGAEDDGPRKAGLCVWERAKSSDELEQREADYYAAMNNPDLLDRNPLFPVPFFDEAGNLEPLSKADRGALMDVFGVTEEEYRRLYEGELS